MEWDSLRREISTALAQSLAILLPEIGGKNWWPAYVLAELTPAQRSQAEKLPQPDIFQLDMAALLRVLDRNWGELIVKRDFPKNGRNLVKELMSVRNRWAHEPAGGHDLEDLYRDLDTARRLLEILGASPELVSRINEYRLAILSRLAAAGQSSPPKSDAPTAQEPAPPEAPSQSDNVAGASLTVIGAGPISTRDGPSFARHFSHRSYVGIDFGTSTTVASYIKLDDTATHVIVEPITLAQTRPDGVTTRHHLVPSCIALNPADGSVLYGIGAKELQYQLREGIDVWSSFKMDLGVDLGPRYRNTRLKAGQGAITIEKPQDAAREFFRFLRRGILDFLERNQLPKAISLAVSVPASFEANQRRDLLKALQDAGFSLDESCLIDEPNAAFLSVLHESWLEKAPFVEYLRTESRNLLVFDFGAGTCDISILRISVGADSVRSRNLSISRFIALGGNNIDRAIAERYLLPQMMSQSAEGERVTSEQTELIVLPRLMPVAERLKIQCSKMLAQRGIKDVADCLSIDDRVTEHSIPELRIGSSVLQLDHPSIAVAEFAEIMGEFVSRPDHEVEGAFPGACTSVFVPIESALSKALIDREQLHTVIFIGGSSENPLIQGAIKDYFGRFVDTLIPRDLRTHVSQGAAFHSFAHHAFGADVIQPITSEPVLLVTANAGLETVLDAGVEVPTPIPFVTRFAVLRDDQDTLELPLCVTSEDKILSVLSIFPPEGTRFRKGQPVTLKCRMTADKLLEVAVTIDGRQTTVEQLNPLANAPLDEAESSFLLARQRFNRAVLDGYGKPPVSEVISYASAASEAGRYLQAAELYEQIERMDPGRNFATSICYNYDRAARPKLAEKWAQVAYEREKCPTTAFNIAIFKRRIGKASEAKKYLEEAIRQAPNYASALVFLGELLEDEHKSGHAHFERAINVLKEELKTGTIDGDDCRRLARVARKLGDTKLAARAELFAQKSGGRQALYDEANLVGAVGNVTRTAKG